MKRRTFLAGAAASLVAGTAGTLSFAWADGEDDFYSDASLQELFENNSEDIKPAGAVARLSSEQYKDILETLARGEVSLGWSAVEQSPDYFHLAEPRSDTPFEIGGAHLARLVESNKFSVPLDADNPKVLFGLRGCSVASSAGEAYGTEVALVEAVPDHYTQKCVMGVWDTSTGEIWAFNASTVPDAAYVYAQAERIEGANMMPTGLYRYDVGTHGLSRPKPANRQPGAWRQAGIWPVRRIVGIPEGGLLAYTHAAIWDVGNGCELRSSTGNNIHAGILDRSSLKVRYSSAGCQVLPGRYEPRGQMPVGAYARFRVAAGLPQVPVITGATTPEDGRRFAYMLLTGREARLAVAGAAEPALSRLRYGSRGASVRRIQQALVARGHECVPEDGSMLGMRSIAALVKVQQELGLVADGIVTPELSEKLGAG
jgi:hypothetical protein